MQENEFEKQVRQKMGAFQLQPTDAVWEKLQLEVTNGKERKRKYVIFSFLMIALLGCTLLLNDLKQPINSTNRITGKITGENLSQKEDAGNNLPPTQQPNIKPAQAVPLSADNYTSNKKQQQNLIALTNDKTSHHKIKRTTRGRAKIKVTPAIVADEEGAINDNVISDKKQSPVTDMAVTNKKPAIAADDSVTVNDNNISNKDQTLITNMAVTNKIKPTFKIIDRNDTLVKAALQLPEVKENGEPIIAIQIAPKKEKKKPWSTSFSLAAGWSSTGSKYLDGNSAASYDNSGVGSTPNSGNYYHPSVTKPRFSLSSGIEVSRALSAKTTVVTGLQYRLFTTSIATGDQVSTPAASGNRQNVFKSGSSKRYTSFYHFITIPVSFSTQIATIKAREINLTAGVNFSRLIHTNALQFDNVQGNYYRDNTIFNKTQFGLSAAFFINLAGKNKAPFYIGPDFYYSLTPQAASGMYTASHYKSFGIQLKKMLQKNKSAAATH